jgi:hypothetical protein
MKTQSLTLLVGQLLLPIFLPFDLRAVPRDEAAFSAHAGQVMGWRDLYQLVKRFQNCPDDAFFVEGYSELVVHNLATRWEMLHELEILTESDPSFRNFVLKHIDATADETELKAVEQNALERCVSPGKKTL